MDSNLGKGVKRTKSKAQKEDKPEIQARASLAKRPEHLWLSTDEASGSVPRAGPSTSRCTAYARPQATVDQVDHRYPPPAHGSSHEGNASTGAQLRLPLDKKKKSLSPSRRYAEGFPGLYSTVDKALPFTRVSASTDTYPQANLYDKAPPAANPAIASGSTSHTGLAYPPATKPCKEGFPGTFPTKHNKAWPFTVTTAIYQQLHLSDKADQPPPPTDARASAAENPAQPTATLQSLYSTPPDKPVVYQDNIGTAHSLHSLGSKYTSTPVRQRNVIHVQPASSAAGGPSKALVKHLIDSADEAGEVTIALSCKRTYDDIKKHKKHRYAIFYITEEKRVLVEKVGPRDASCEKFLEDLQKGGDDEPRYGLFDFEPRVNVPFNKHKFLLMSCSPFTANVKKKILYSSTFEALKKALVGLHNHFQVTELP